MPRRLLVIGPSFRRNMSDEVISAIDRYEGIFFRTARRYLRDVKDVDVLVMKDDLTLIDAKTPLPYTPPQGEKWGLRSISESLAKKAKKENKVVLSRKSRNRRYSEVFLAMGREYAKGLPELSRYSLRVVFPNHGGIGPKAQSLKAWLSKDLRGL